MIGKILQFDPEKRIKITDILEHEWFNPLLLSTNDTEKYEVPSEMTLGTTQEEVILAAKLKSIGIDVDSLLESVQSNSCDQSSALWYLLLDKERKKITEKQASTKSTVTKRLIIPDINGADLDNSGSISISLDVEQHFSEATKRGKNSSENPILALSRKSAQETKLLNNNIDQNRRRSANGPYSPSPRGNKLLDSGKNNSVSSSRRAIMLEAMSPKLNRSLDEFDSDSKISLVKSRPKSASARASARKTSQEAQIVEEPDENF